MASGAGPQPSPPSSGGEGGVIRQLSRSRRSRYDDRGKNASSSASVDPFSRGSNKNHFPGLDDIFDKAGAAPHGHGYLSPVGRRPLRPSARQRPVRTPQRSASGTNDEGGSGGREVSFAMTPDRAAAERSMCSFASPQNNMINVSADMSIGTRAALADHQRHAHAFGLDEFAAATALSPSSGTPRGGGGKQLSQVDEEWNRMCMDTSCAQTSVISGYGGAEGGSRIVSETPDRRSRGGAFATEMSVELEHGADTSAANPNDVSDFFNSSRVRYLMTPEKNRDKVDRASRLARLGVGAADRRGGNAYDSYESSAGDSAAGASTASGSAAADRSGESSSSVGGMAFLFSQAVRLNEHPAESSLAASFCASEQASILSQETSSGSHRRAPWMTDSSGSQRGGGNNSSGNNRSSASASPNVTFQEEDGGVELITDMSDILSEFQVDSLHSSTEHEHEPVGGEMSIPQQNPFRSSMLSPGKEKENLAFLALSPIASRVGSAAAENQTPTAAGQPSSQRTIASERKKRGRLPLSPIAKLSSNKGRLPPGRYARKLTPRTRPVDTTTSPIGDEHRNALPETFSDRNTIGGSCANISGCSQTANDAAVSPFCHVSTSTASEWQSSDNRSVDISERARGRKDSSKLAISSLRERYSRPDRFEDGFSDCATPAGRGEFSALDDEELDDSLQSASKSLLSSFERSFEEPRSRLQGG